MASIAARERKRPPRDRWPDEETGLQAKQHPSRQSTFASEPAGDHLNVAATIASRFATAARVRAVQKPSSQKSVATAAGQCFSLLSRGGTRPPECRFSCRRRPSCGHPPVDHNCHSDETSCPKCPFLVEKLCACGKEKLHSQPCHIQDARCGRVCGKKLKCGLHNCKKLCHRPGECEDAALEDMHCEQACGKIKLFCEHPCQNTCHGQTGTLKLKDLHVSFTSWYELTQTQHATNQPPALPKRSSPAHAEFASKR